MVLLCPCFLKQTIKMFCSSSLVSCFYAASLLTTQLAANPVGSAALSFQAEPLSQVASFKGWPSDADEPSPDTFFAISSSLQPNDVQNSILPIPSFFVGLFECFLNWLSLFSPVAHPDRYEHHFGKPIECTKCTIGHVNNPQKIHLSFKYASKDIENFHDSQGSTRCSTTLPSPSAAPPSQDKCGSDAHPTPLHRLAWLINVSSPVQEAVNNPDADFTLFAPDNDALMPPSKKRRDLMALKSMSDCPNMNLWAEGEDNKKEPKKNFFLHAVEMVLKYHVSPGSKRIHEILDNSTLPTEILILPTPDAPCPRKSSYTFSPN
ncbi:hypothetical protein PtB15_4B597 [Puccinia triticina]|nr:hypothetical protein PtB15_4B597 [Puccinia triticina]